MSNNLPQNLDCLLDKNWVESFLTKNSQKIFDEPKSIQVLKIERSKSFAPESFAMFYEITANYEKIFLRASASTSQDRSLPFAVMTYIYNHGFNAGDFQVSKPLAYFEDLNLMFYLNLGGRMFRDVLSDQTDLTGETFKIGQALKKLHSLPQNNLVSSHHVWSFNNEKILSYCPEMSDVIIRNQNNSLEKIETNKYFFCHGDFQPENIVISDKIFIIDFGSVVAENRELDIACFVSQLDIMLKRYGNPDYFETLKKSFLTGYGDYDQTLFDCYYQLYDFEILQALIAIYEEDPNINKEKILNVINYWHTKMKEKYV